MHRKIMEFFKKQKDNPRYAIKLCTKNFGFEDKKKTVPLYAAFCI